MEDEGQNVEVKADANVYVAEAAAKKAESTVVL